MMNNIYWVEHVGEWGNGWTGSTNYDLLATYLVKIRRATT